MFSILADIVVLIHMLWILFLIFGAFLGTRHRALKYIHLGGLGYAVLIQIFGWYCPLTHLEFWLRRLHNPLQVTSDSFLIHYVEKIVYLEISRQAIFVLTIMLLTFNLVIYLRNKRTQPGRTS